jgi:hypothetical protein
MSVCLVKITNIPMLRNHTPESVFDGLEFSPLAWHLEYKHHGI